MSLFVGFLISGGMALLLAAGWDFLTLAATGGMSGGSYYLPFGIISIVILAAGILLRKFKKITTPFYLYILIAIGAAVLFFIIAEIYIMFSVNY